MIFTSIYIHIPFCKHRCAYCDFNTYANQESLIPAYVNALANEIRFVGNQVARSELPMTISTVFFGGGTPSLLSPAQFETVLNALAKSFHFAAEVEITTEANPGTVSLSHLRGLRAAGVNRISYGAQSANAEELRMLERAHDFLDVIQAVRDSRKAGFTNLNLDLIYGLPEQTLASWKKTLARIVDLRPEHISAYALTLEHGTPFGRWSTRGLLPIPDPDLAAEMYEHAEDFLAKNGYAHYEISNWAKDSSSFTCKHNLQYWRSLPYLAFGAGAHGYAGGYRYSNVLRIKTYIERAATAQFSDSNLQFPLSPAVVHKHKQTLQDDISDYMINNLRLTENGVSNEDFTSRFGRGLLDVFPNQIEELIHNGLLEYVKRSETLGASERYRLTKRGRLLGNMVFQKFV